MGDKAASETICGDFDTYLDTLTEVPNNAVRTRPTGLNDTESGISLT
jgi:hypothetical protein